MSHEPRGESRKSRPPKSKVRGLNPLGDIVGPSILPQTPGVPAVVGSPRTLLVCFTACAVSLFVGCSPSATSTIARPASARHESTLDAGVAAEVERLVDRMHQRLVMMHLVALEMAAAPADCRPGARGRLARTNRAASARVGLGPETCSAFHDGSNRSQQADPAARYEPLGDATADDAGCLARPGDRITSPDRSAQLGAPRNPGPCGTSSGRRARSATADHDRVQDLDRRRVQRRDSHHGVGAFIIIG